MEVKRLIRLDDGKEFIGSVLFVIYVNDGNGKEISVNPVIGSRCVVGLEDYPMHQWQTSYIVDVYSDTEFRTENSSYRID